MSSATRRDSQKFFTLIFAECNEDGLQEATKIPAKRGRTLHDLVPPILENYGLSVESHSLFVGSSTTPLPLNADTHPYGGLTLYVRENERTNIEKRLISFMRSDSRKHLGAKRFSQLLEEHEAAPINRKCTESNGGLAEGDPVYADVALESCWNEVITETEEMSIRSKQQQQAIWELCSTERSYINDIRVIIEVFKKTFKMLQYGGYMTEVDDTFLFANIEQVYHANLEFWKRLKETITTARITKQPISPKQLVGSFSGFDGLFQPYISFCNADTSNIKLAGYSQYTTELIKQYIAWCDNHAQTKRITMSGFLIKPLQRVTRYSLLLKAILKKTDDASERRVVEEVMATVETFVSKINSVIHLRQEEEKMNCIEARFSDYFPVETVTEEVEKILKDFSKLTLKGTVPGVSGDDNRCIIKEGNMKMVEKQGKKDVYVLLFSDLLVIAKLKRNSDKFRVTRPPYRLNKVVLLDLKDASQFLFLYLNEYGVLASAFVLQLDVQERVEWCTAIENAKREYLTLREKYASLTHLQEDDTHTFPVSEDNLFRRISNAHESTLARQLTILPETTPSESMVKVEYEWDTGLSVVVVLLFIAVNVTVSRMFGY